MSAFAILRLSSVYRIISFEGSLAQFARGYYLQRLLGGPAAEVSVLFVVSSLQGTGCRADFDLRCILAKMSQVQSDRAMPGLGACQQVLFLAATSVQRPSRFAMVLGSQS